MCHVHSTTHIYCSQDQIVNILQQPHIWYLKHNVHVLPLPLTLCPMPNVHISCPPPTWPFPISCTNVPSLCFIPPPNVHSPNCIMFQMCLSHAHRPHVHTPYYVSHDECSCFIPHPHVHVSSPSHVSMYHAPLICACFMPHWYVHISFHVHVSSCTHTRMSIFHAPPKCPYLVSCSCLILQPHPHVYISCPT